jgi:hypothetical protein
LDNSLDNCLDYFVDNKSKYKSIDYYIVEHLAVNNHKLDYFVEH